VSEPRIVYRSRHDATPEMELNALSVCYAFILQKHQERQQAAHPGGPDDAKKESKHVGAKTIISE
jgi:hypothetical protein